MAKCTQVDLIRHGAHQLGDVVAGISDPPLTEKGWQQLVEQTDLLIENGANWDICLSSPRQRCAAFAADFSQRLGLDYAIDDGFAEVDFGSWEALSFKQIEAQYPGQWQQWLRQKTPPHGGESYPDFQHRINCAWSRLMAKYGGKKILLFMHGGVAKAIFAHTIFTGAPQSTATFAAAPAQLTAEDTFYKFNIPHACHSRLMVYHLQGAADWCQLEAHNTGAIRQKTP